MSAVGSLAARAQQAVAPVIGFISTRSPEEAEVHTNAFRRGLEEVGYLEGNGVIVEYRWANGDYRKLPSLAADLLSRPLSLVAAFGAMLLYGAASAGIAALIQPIFDQVLPTRENLVPIAAAILIVYFLKGIGAYLSGYLMTDVGQITSSQADRLAAYVQAGGTLLGSRLP